MQIRSANVYEISEFIAESLDRNAKGAEDDHQDEYLGAQALDTKLGVVVQLQFREAPSEYLHVTGLNVEDDDFFLNLRCRMQIDDPEAQECKHESSCHPFTQQQCEWIMSTPPEWVYGHEDSSKVLQVWSVQGGLLIDLGGIDTWFAKYQS